MVIRNQAVEKDQTSAHSDFNVDVHLLSCLIFMCNVREQMSCFFFFYYQGDIHLFNML